MMPVISNTQIPLPTQVSFIATPMPATQTLRVAPHAVSPSGFDVAITPDHKGTGGYAPAAATNTLTTSIAPATLSTLIPASFSTSTASLSANAMFATQLLSQDAQGAGELLATYEALAEASQVKYKPSNATLPEPAPNNLFARMMAETQNQNVRIVTQAQHAPVEVAAQAMSQPVATAVKPVQATRQKTASEISPAEARLASHAYQSAAVRNDSLREPVEAIDEVGKAG